MKQCESMSSANLIIIESICLCRRKNICKQANNNSNPSHLLSTTSLPLLHNIIMATYLITGSSRGLGLAIVSRLASLPQTEVSRIFATARQDNSTRLRELVDSSSGRVRFLPLDVTDENGAIEAASVVDRQLQGRGLDVLVNNAGVMPVTKQGLEGMYDSNSSLVAP